MAIRVVGAGCCLMDLLYPQVDFSSADFARFRSRESGDGGLSPGHLVFSADVERFSAKANGRRDTIVQIVDSLALGRSPTLENIGGPSVVSLIHASQMLEGEGVEVCFHGVRGSDRLGDRLEHFLRRTPLSLREFRTLEGATPSTFVLSDPSWDFGKGERCFINELGVAASFRAEQLPGEFFGADMVALGGTALVPPLHRELPGVLTMAKQRGALTVVNTVFDFHAERIDPVGPWPLGGHLARAGVPGPEVAYGSCDLLIGDRDEAIRLAGTNNLDGAISRLIATGVGALAVTRGADEVIAWSGGHRLRPLALSRFPVLKRPTTGDTTGCGDAFAGGILASLALQMARGNRLDLEEAIGWGIAGGAYTLSILGGTHFDRIPGEKKSLVEQCHTEWLKELE